MMKENLIKSSRTLLLSMLCLASLTSPVLAESKSVSVTSDGKLGAVDISYSDEVTKAAEAVVPGYEMELNSYVTNNAEPCWIRVKIEYDTRGDLTGSRRNADGVDAYEFDESCVNLADDNWIHIGDYYYYPTVVKNKEKIDFVKSVKTPVDWGNETSDVTFETFYTAEAVQAKNFTPNFNSDDPWYGTVIQAFDTSNYKLKEAGNDRFQVICDPSAKELIAVGDDFFNNWENMMPGDVLTGELTISNKMNIPVKMYFSTKNTGDSELLTKLHMVIKNNDKVVFDSNLSSDINPETLIQEYSSGESSKLTYELTIPEELDNAYALKELESVWTFRADIPEKQKKATPVATGDHSMNAITYGAMATGGAFVVALAKKRKESDLNV